MSQPSCNLTCVQLVRIPHLTSLEPPDALVPAQVPACEDPASASGLELIVESVGCFSLGEPELSAEFDEEGKDPSGPPRRRERPRRYTKADGPNPARPPPLGEGRSWIVAKPISSGVRLASGSTAHPRQFNASGDRLVTFRAVGTVRGPRAQSTPRLDPAAPAPALWRGD